MSSRKDLKKEEKKFLGFIKKPFRSDKSPSPSLTHSRPASSHTPSINDSLAPHSDVSTTINVGSGTGVAKLLNIPRGRQIFGKRSPASSRPSSSHTPTTSTSLASDLNPSTHIIAASGSGTAEVEELPENQSFNSDVTVETSTLSISTPATNTVAASARAPEAPALSQPSPEAPEQTRNEAFERAIQKYVNNRLPDDVKKDFHSASDIMEKLQKMQSSESGSGGKICISSSISDRVKKVLQCLRHFLGSVAICIQHHPDISSLVVGGVNCILTLALGYIEFFESLTEMMERIGGHLSYLSQYSNTTFQNSQSIQDALVQVYCDLLEFYAEARCVLVDKAGKSSYLHGFKQFLRITWEPFEAQFQTVETRFKHHADIVIRLANVEHQTSWSRTMDNQNKQYEKHQLVEEEKRGQEANELRRQILRWLSPDDYAEIHEEHYGKRFRNTGQWLLDDPRFISWRDGMESSLLWCHGTPGSGKTVLASMVIEHLSALYELSQNTGVTFLYCNYKESRTPSTYIRLALKQLCRRIPHLPPVLEKVYKLHYWNDSQPTYVELGGVFNTIIQQFDSVFLILDALDECTTDQRKALCEFVLGSVKPQAMSNTVHDIGTTSTTMKSQGILRLFITSRRESDLERTFLQNSIPTIEIEAAKVDKDIEDYVKAQIQQRLQDGNLVLKNMALKEKILSALTTKAGGMFLWVKFQLDTICTQISDLAIEEALEKVPEDMDETYERILNTIDRKPRGQRGLAIRILMCIAYSRTPLPITLLADAVSVTEATRTLEALESSTPTQAMILDVCANLISIDSTTQYVRFVHFSVQEFLISYRSGSINALEIGYEVGHREIARMFITLLSILYAHPAGGYTAIEKYSKHLEILNEWPHHLLAANLNNLPISHQMITLTSKFLGKSPPVFVEFSGRGMQAVYFSFSPSVLTLIFNLPEAYHPHPLRSIPFEKNQWLSVHGIKEFIITPSDDFAMHYTTRVLNCTTVAQRLYSRGYPIDYAYRITDSLLQSCISSSDPTKLPAMCEYTPLYSATDEKIAEFLLENGVSVEPQILSGEFVDPLVFFARKGNIKVTQLLLDRVVDTDGERQANALSAIIGDRTKSEIIQLLLNNNANPDSQNELFCKLLQAAACQGNIEAISFLLEKGADVNAQGGHYGNALQAAACDGKVEIIQLLLDHGAIVNTRGGYYSNALQAAAWNDNIEAMQLLLDQGADVNAQGGKWDNALQAAARNRSVRAMQLLLDHEVDIDAFGKSALNAAARSGNIVGFELLVDKGANSKTQDEIYGNALQAAAYRGQVEDMLHLLDEGVDVNASGGEYGNALQAAAYSGEVEAMQLLLDKGADTNTLGGHYGNALQAAAYSGKVRAMQLLLDTGVAINVQGGHYGYALQAAAYSGEVEAMQLLLDNGADVNARGGEHGTALQAAAYKGKLAAMWLLLDNGADVDAQNEDYNHGLLCSAVHSGQLEALQLLLDKGTNVNAQDGFYGNVLQYATVHANIETIQLLLEKGADINAPGGRDGTALQAAVAVASMEIIQLLLDKGADVNTQGGMFGTALQAAVAFKNMEAIQLLLDKGADVNIQGGLYGTALQAAVAFTNMEAIRLLLEKGAGVNTQGGIYGTALQVAGMKGNMEVIQLLLENGADVNIQGGMFGTVLQAAAYRGDIKVIQLLLDKGANVNVRCGKYGAALKKMLALKSATTGLKVPGDFPLINELIQDHAPLIKENMSEFAYERWIEEFMGNVDRCSLDEFREILESRGWKGDETDM